MFKRSLKLLPLGIILLLAGCQEREAQESNNISDDAALPAAQTLVLADTLSVGADTLYSVFSMLAHNDMILMTVMHPKYLAATYHPQSQELQYFLPKGEGAEELAFPLSIQALSFEKNTSSIGIYERQRWRFHTGTQGEGMNKFKNFALQKSSRNFDVNYQNLVQIHPNYFLGVGIFRNRYVVSDQKGAIVDSLLDYPFEKELNIHYYYLAMNNQAKLFLHPEGSHVVSFYDSAIDILAISSEGKPSLVSRILYQKPSIEKGSHVNPSHLTSNLAKEHRFGFIKGQVSKRYVYALLSGKSYEQDENASTQGQEIRQYDYEGTLIQRWQLSRPINSFAVSPDDSRIYAFVDGAEALLLQGNLQ
jgi:hypothetical protein